MKGEVEVEVVPTAYDERVVGDEEDVEEIVVRGRVKVVPRADGGERRQKPKASEAQGVEQVALTERFLEQEEDAVEDVAMEGKYDSDGDDEENKHDTDGEQQQQQGRRSVNGDEEEDGDEKEQLKRAIALSMTYPVHAMDENDDEVQEVANRPAATQSTTTTTTTTKSKPTIVLTSNRRASEKRMLDTIAEEEMEMAVELKEQQRDDDTDELMIVEKDATTTTADSSVVSQSATVGVTTLRHNAVRAEEEGTAPAVEEAESAVTSIQASAAPVESAAAVAPVTTESASPAVVVPAAPRGFVMPSLATLSARPAAQPTNLFFAEKQKREQERKEREAAQSTAAPAQQPTAEQTSTSSYSPPASSSSSTTPPALATSPSLSAFPSAPIAAWSSASDDPANAAEPSVDAHLSEIYTDSHALSSSLARLKSKQAKQQQQVTTAMLDECRHLLALFGCPYIVAPAEAEAQCAHTRAARPRRRRRHRGQRRVPVRRQPRVPQHIRAEEVCRALPHGRDRSSAGRGQGRTHLAGTAVGLRLHTRRARRGHCQCDGDRQCVPREGQRGVARVSRVGVQRQCGEAAQGAEAARGDGRRERRGEDSA